MVGCQQDEMTSSMKKGSYSLVASIENNDSTSRTAVDENGGVTWVETDAIGVFGTKTKNAKFESTGAGANVTFAGELESSNEEPTLAYYPYNENASLDGNSLSFTLPSEYTYTGESNAPMLGVKQADGTFSFKHLCGLLKVTVKNMPENAKRLFVVSEGTDEKEAPFITGDVTVNDVTADGATLSITKNGSREVSIDLKNVSAQETYTLYIPVPVGNYPELSVKLEMNDGIIYFDKSLSDVDMKRSMLLDMPILDATKEATSITAIVRGTVDIENPEGLKIESLIDDSELTEEGFTIEVFSNNLPQYIYVTDADGNIRMMSHTYPKDIPLQIDAHSTALALVTMLPPFLCSSSEVFEEVKKTIVGFSCFSNVVIEVQKCIDENKEILSTDNTVLLQAISTLVEDLHEPTSRSYIGTPIEGINTVHLDVARMALSNTLNIRNTELYPPYECTIKDENDKLVMYDMIPSAEGYGGWVGIQDVFVNNSQHYGPCVEFPLLTPGVYSVLCDGTTDVANHHFVGYLANDIFSCLGGIMFDVPLLAKIWGQYSVFPSFYANVKTNILEPYKHGDMEQKEAVEEFIRLFFKLSMELIPESLEYDQYIKLLKCVPQLKELKDKELRKIALKDIGKKASLAFLKKVLFASSCYDLIKGGFNLYSRFNYWKNSTPQISFKVRYHNNPNNEIVCYSESALEIVKGNEQIGQKGVQLEVPLTVKVVTTADNGLPYWNDRLYVKFETIDGAGYVTNYIKLDEETKLSSVNWTLGYSGEQKVRVVAIDLFTETEISEPIYFTAHFEGEEEKGTVTTTGSTNETQTTATLSGNIQGYETDDFQHRYGIIYSTDTNPTASNGTIVYSNNIQENGNYSVDVTSLTENTTYYYRAFVINGGNYVYGDVMSFMTQSKKSERDILIAFYNANGGDNWRDKRNWCTDKPLGEWGGISTNKDGFVVNISLRYNYSSHVVGNVVLNGLTHLENLHLDNHQITALDVSGCTNLKTIRCESNDNLTSLNVEGCYNLEAIYAYDTQLASLDVSNRTKLKIIDVHNNKGQLRYLNLTGCNNLEEVDIEGSPLFGALNLNHAVNLKILNCNSCQLSELLIRQCINIEKVECKNNQLESLDISNAYNMTRLDCRNNLLSNIAFPTLSILETVDCTKNQLSDLSNLLTSTTLKMLDCSNNNLTELNVLNNSNVTAINADDNQLSKINVKNCFQLRTLNCNRNKLKEIDVSNLIELEHLGCTKNQITKLHLDNNIKLKSISSSYTQITEINLEDCIELTDLNLSYNNDLELLDVSSAKQLKYLDAICKSLKYVYLPVGFVLNIQNNSISGFRLWNETAGEFTEDYHMLGYQYPEFRWK